MSARGRAGWSARHDAGCSRPNGGRSGPGAGGGWSEGGGGGERCRARAEAAGPRGPSAAPGPRSSGPARRTQRGRRARASCDRGARRGARSQGALWRSPPRSPAPGPTPLPPPPPRPSPPLSLRPAPPAARPFTTPLSAPPALFPLSGGGDFSGQRRSRGWEPSGSANPLRAESGPLSQGRERTAGCGWAGRVFPLLLLAPASSPPLPVISVPQEGLRRLGLP